MYLMVSEHCRYSLGLPKSNLGSLLECCTRSRKYVSPDGVVLYGVVPHWRTNSINIITRTHSRKHAHQGCGLDGISIEAEAEVKAGPFHRGRGRAEAESRPTCWLSNKQQVFTFAALCLPSRRYDRAGLCYSDVSVCPSVCHTPVLCLAERKQDRKMYTIW